MQAGTKHVTCCLSLHSSQCRHLVQIQSPEVKQELLLFSFQGEGQARTGRTGEGTSQYERSLVINCEAGKRTVEKGVKRRKELFLA